MDESDAESTILNAASSPKLVELEGSLTEEERVWNIHMVDLDRFYSMITAFA